MIVRKFEGRSIEDALRLVKEALGPEALILSTQNRKGGWFRRPSVEVTAAFSNRPETKKTKEFDEGELERVFPHRRLEKVIGEEDLESERAARRKGTPTGSRAPGAVGRALGSASTSTTGRGIEREGRKTAPKMVLPPETARVEREFTDLGLSVEAAQELAGRVLLDFGKTDRNDPAFMDKVKTKLLAAGMKTLGPEIFESRRCWAAVGTPGSGKTSLVVKLGLRLRNNRQSVALVSCDRRKLLGRQELAAYAKLIRAPFSTQVRGDRAGAKVQLIDTPSLVWESAEGIEEVEKICRDMNALLVLDASQRLGELLRTVEKASCLAPVALAFTRLDTVAQAGVVYEVLRAVKLPLLGASISFNFSTPFQFFEPADLGRWIVNKIK